MTTPLMLAKEFWDSMLSVMSSHNKMHLAVGVVQSNTDKILLIERAVPESLKDGSVLFITFPSGKVDPGEKPNDAVEREVIEETGYRVRPITEIYSGPHMIAPVDVTYYGCDIAGYNMYFEQPSEIKRVFWVARTALQETVETQINPAVLDYLGLNY